MENDAGGELNAGNAADQDLGVSVSDRWRPGEYVGHDDRWADRWHSDCADQKISVRSLCHRSAHRPVIVVVILCRMPVIRDAHSQILVSGISSIQLPTSISFHTRVRWLHRAARPRMGIDTAARWNHNATARPTAAGAASITFPCGRCHRWLHGTPDANAAEIRAVSYTHLTLPTICSV